MHNKFVPIYVKFSMGAKVVKLGKEPSAKLDNGGPLGQSDIASPVATY